MRCRLPQRKVNFTQARLLVIDRLDARARVKFVLLTREFQPSLRALQHRR